MVTCLPTLGIYIVCVVCCICLFFVLRLGARFFDVVVLICVIVGEFLLSVLGRPFFFPALASSCGIVSSIAFCVWHFEAVLLFSFPLCRSTVRVRCASGDVVPLMMCMV